MGGGDFSITVSGATGRREEDRRKGRIHMERIETRGAMPMPMRDEEIEPPRLLPDYSQIGPR